MTSQRRLKSRTAVLTPTIRMQKKIVVHTESSKSHFQRRKKYIRRHLMAHRPSDYSPRKHIERKKGVRNRFEQIYRNRFLT
jgi:hypothetical protein